VLLVFCIYHKEGIVLSLHGVVRGLSGLVFFSSIKDKLFAKLLVKHKYLTRLSTIPPETLPLEKTELQGLYTAERARCKELVNANQGAFRFPGWSWV